MIYIEVIHYKWEPGKKIISDHKIEKEFERYIANEYVRLVRKRIDEQKYRSKWLPLSLKYLKWKRDNGLSDRTWEATGQLKRDLKVKLNNVIGYDNRAKHKLTGENLNVIAREMEYGSTRLVARPLFRPVLWYMSKNINYFYNKFMREVLR